MNIYKEIQEKYHTGSNMILLKGLDGEMAGKITILKREIPILKEDKAELGSEGNELLDLPENECWRKIRPGMIMTEYGRVFAEPIGAQPELIICGAGHVSMPVISIGKELGFRVIVIDDRPKFANVAKGRGADHVICDDFQHALREIDGGRNTYFIIVTRGHLHDKDCLRIIAEKPAAYIGMIGSRRRVALVMASLKEEGVDPAVLDSVYTPIGLDIGAETPEEIGVAILAEIIQVKNRVKRTSGFSPKILNRLAGEGEPCILATIVARRGSAPRDVGSKMIIERDGTILGTIGGGCVEGDIITTARQMLIASQKDIQIISVDLTNDDAAAEGMVCGGTLEILLERIK